MSAIETEFPGIVRAVVTEIGIVTGMAGSVTEVVKMQSFVGYGRNLLGHKQILCRKTGVVPDRHSTSLHGARIL